MTASSELSGTASRSAAHWRRATVDGPTPLWLSYTDALPAAVEALVGADPHDECTDADGKKGGGAADAQEHRAASAACSHAVVTRLPCGCHAVVTRLPRLASGAAWVGGRTAIRSCVRCNMRLGVCARMKGRAAMAGPTLCAHQLLPCIGPGAAATAIAAEPQCDTMKSVSLRRTHEAMYSDE
jgi:hypothetical protein